MKRDNRNPGGENYSPMTMKGCEKFQARGKGSVLGAYPQIGSNSDSKIAGMTSGGNVQKSGYALTSTSGAKTHGTGKGLK